MKYTVFVDDNFHYTDEDERYKLGEFDTREEAVAAAKRIIEEFLDPAYEPWMTAQEMYEGYVMFGDDIAAKAREFIKSEQSLTLTRPEPVTFEAQPTTWDETVRAVLNCMAYDYEVKIAINGAPIDFTGGKSFSGILVGAAGGAPPLSPAVLQAGENRINLEYRKTKQEEGPGLELTINVLPEQLSFRLVTARKQSGKVSAKFVVPPTPSERVSPVEIDDDVA